MKSMRTAGYAKRRSQVSFVAVKEWSMFEVRERWPSWNNNETLRSTNPKITL